MIQGNSLKGGWRQLFHLREDVSSVPVVPYPVLPVRYSYFAVYQNQVKAHRTSVSPDAEINTASQAQEDRQDRIAGKIISKIKGKMQLIILLYSRGENHLKKNRSKSEEYADDKVRWRHMIGCDQMRKKGRQASVLVLPWNDVTSR